MRELFDQIVWRDHILTLLQLGGAMLLLIFSLVYHFEEQEELNNARADLDAQIYANDEAEANSYLLAEYLEPYRKLQLQGYIGSPQRLQWLESLRTIGEDNNIPEIEFTLEGSELVQQNVDPYWQEDVPMSGTNMKITMQLSHEGDLYNVLEELKDQAPGLFNVKQCYFQWLDNSSDETVLSRLRGACDLRWYTAKDVTENWHEAQ